MKKKREPKIKKLSKEELQKTRLGESDPIIDKDGKPKSKPQRAGDVKL